MNEGTVVEKRFIQIRFPADGIRYVSITYVATFWRRIEKIENLLLHRFLRVCFVFAYSAIHSARYYTRVLQSFSRRNNSTVRIRLRPNEFNNAAGPIGRPWLTLIREDYSRTAQTYSVHLKSVTRN